MPRPVVLLSAYAVVAVIHLITRLVESDIAELVTKAMLMPLLAAYLISATQRPLTRMVRVVLAALAFSWIGDMSLELQSFVDADGLFLLGLGGFLVAQVLYVVAFTPLIRASTPPRPPFWALVYVPAVALLVAVLAPEVGDLLVPVAVYAAAIALMAIVASGVNRWTAMGAFAFVASDALLATVRWDVLELSAVAERLAVMSTYTLAQGLLVYGVVVAQRGIWQETPEQAPS